MGPVRFAFGAEGMNRAEPLKEREFKSSPFTETGTGSRELMLLVAVVFTAALIFRLLAFTGLIASDDLDYAYHAWRVSTGAYTLEQSHYAIRYGVILPLAAVFRFFGVHEWTMVLLPLLGSSLAPVLAALVAARLAGVRAAWITGMLMATFPVDVRYGSILVPEPLLQALVLAAALLFLIGGTRNSKSIGFAAGVLFGISYLTKEPGVFVAAAFGIFAILRRQWRLAFAVALGAGLVAAGELVWYFSQTGDVLFRLHAMAAHNRSPMAIAANEHLFYRLWEAYPRMMLVPNADFGLHSLAALGLAILALLCWRSPNKILLILWATLPFVYLNFGTTSFHHYWALPVAPRYIALIYPPLFVLASIPLLRLARVASKYRWLSPMILAFTCIVGIWCAVHTRRTGYNTEDVRTLREIATTARRQNYQICDFNGPEHIRWRSALLIIAPDVVGCSHPGARNIQPDSNGRPVSADR